MAEREPTGPSPSPRQDRRRAAITKTPEELKRRRIAIGIVAFFLLVIAGTAIAFYVTKFVLPPKQLVVRVDDVKYTRSDMLKLLMAKRKQLEIFGEDFRYGSQVFEVLQQIVEDEIIAKAAPRLGITVPETDVDLQLRVMFQPRSDDSEASIEQLEREYEENFKAFLNEVQISRSEFRRLLSKDVLRSRVRQYIGERTVNVAEQVHLHRLLMSASDEIEIMQEKYKDLLDGSAETEDLQRVFKEIVREFSRDEPETIRKGGDLGWVPSGVMTSYEDLFFDLELGELSEPTADTENPRLSIFFMVSEREDARSLDEADRNVLKDSALKEWVNQERDNHEVFAKFNTDIYNWFVAQLKLTATITPTPSGIFPGSRQ